MLNMQMVSAVEMLNMQMVSTVETLMILIPAVAIGAPVFRAYLNVKIGPAMLISLGTFITAFVIGWSFDWEVVHRSIPRIGTVLGLTATVFSAAAILGFLYEKWIGNKITEEEKLPGRPGFQAWFQVSNIGFSIVFSVGAFYIFNYSLPALLLLSLGAFAAYPLFTTISAPDQSVPASPSHSPADPNSDLNADRERVLNMLEQGKISPDEGAELLQAIGASSLPAQNPGVPPEKQKFLLIGGALVLFGFLLPWFSFNPADQIAEVWGGITYPGFENLGIDHPKLKDITVHINGGDIEHGLGWIILFAGLGVSVISLIPQTIEESTRKTLSLLLLGVGGIMLLYLLTAEFRHISFGIPLVLIGYALLAAGSFRKTVQSPQASLTPSIQEG